MLRSNVLWFGSRKGRGDGDEFSQRDLALTVVGEASLTPAQLSGARGLVLAFGDGAVSKIRQFAQDNAVKAVEHGLSIYVLASEDEQLLHAQREMDGLGIKGYGSRFGDAMAAPDHDVAQYMARLVPSAAPSMQLVIQPQEASAQLDPADELLLRRAFADCETIQLKELGGGRTADTFMVEARFGGASSLVGPRPLPFFVKLGRNDKIAGEVTKYQDYATHFIPFHLRPNLDLSRCVSGNSRGILVGNFVERADPLWDVACKGEAHAAIHSLFDLTLAGWRAQGFQTSTGKWTGSVAGGLGQRIFDWMEVRQEHQQSASTHGLTRSPQELWESLIECDQCYYRAPMHGDLHPGNVFVRGNDAILIDLASIQHGPLSGDLACLEVSLLFEARPGDEQIPAGDWKKGVDAFYMPETFRHLPVPALETNNWSARLNCAREVRMIALPTQACATEYMSAVAVYLLRRAMHPADNEIDAFRRGYAMIIADRLVTALKAQQQ